MTYKSIRRKSKHGKNTSGCSLRYKLVGTDKEHTLSWLVSMLLKFTELLQHGQSCLRCVLKHFNHTHDGHLRWCGNKDLDCMFRTKSEDRPTSRSTTIYNLYSGTDLCHCRLLDILTNCIDLTSDRPRVRYVPCQVYRPNVVSNSEVRWWCNFFKEDKRIFMMKNIVLIQ